MRFKDDNFTQRQHTFCGRAGKEKTARLSFFHSECTEMGKFHLAILVDTFSNGAKDRIERHLGRHGGGRATQLVPHQFLQSLPVHVRVITRDCCSCGLTE